MRRTLAFALGALLPGLGQGSPAQDYVLYCMGCHGEQAQGVPGRVPPLAHAIARFMRTPAGRSYLLRVPGAANSALSDEALAAVLNWVAQTFDKEDLSPEVALFTAEEAGRMRHVPMLAVLQTRLQTVRELENSGAAPARSY